MLRPVAAREELIMTKAIFGCRDVCGAAIAVVAISAAAPSALAQENSAAYTCQDIGAGPAEPLGDRDGHSISVGQYSCRIDSGPMSGGVVTGTGIWEWDGNKAVLLSNSGVMRKPGATVVYKDTGGNLELTM